MKKGHIFFIMGISGAGKGTLIEGLKKQKDIKLTFLKSYVTRDKRPGEIEGNIYNFISRGEFENSIKMGEFLEYKLVHKLNYYGTKKKEILDDGINKGKKIIKEIEIEGLKEIIGNNLDLKNNITSIFLDISKETLIDRIKTRGDIMSKQELNNRIESIENEKKGSRELCDYIIDTSYIEPEKTLEKVLEIIKNK